MRFQIQINSKVEYIVLNQHPTDHVFTFLHMHVTLVYSMTFPCIVDKKITNTNR
jgi:hypothetical protein